MGKLSHLGMVLMYAYWDIAGKYSRMLWDNHAISLGGQFFVEASDLYHAGLIFTACHEKSLETVLNACQDFWVSCKDLNDVAVGLFKQPYGTGD